MLASWSYDGSQVLAWFSHQSCPQFPKVMIRPAEEDKHLWTMGGISRNASNWNLTASASSIHSTGAQQSFGQQPFMKSTSLTHYIPNMEWSLIDFKTRSNLKFLAAFEITAILRFFRWYDCCPNPYPDICYYFSIKRFRRESLLINVCFRNPSYYLFTLIMPSALITTITVVGFFTPHSTNGENTEKAIRFYLICIHLDFRSVSA